MKKFFALLMVLIALPLMAAKVNEVSTEALMKITQTKSATILDARAGTKLDDSERLPGAKGLAVDSSAEEIKKALPSKKVMLVIYCGDEKSPLGSQLTAKLSKMGYKNILEYRPGIKGWKKAGGAIEKE